MDTRNQYTVGLFTDSYPPIADGVAFVVRNYAFWLTRKSWNSYVLTPSFPSTGHVDEPGVLRYASVPLPVRKPYRLGLPGLDPGFRRRLSLLQFDLVHAHSPFGCAALALKMARKQHIPSVITFHSKYYDDFLAATGSRKIAERVTAYIIRVFNRFDHVWAVNSRTADTLRSYGFKKEIDVVLLGSDMTPPEENHRSRQRMDERYHLQGIYPVFLFVGQHIWQKNVKMLLDVLEHLRKEGVAYRMLFVGAGGAADELKRISNRKKLDDAVQFLGPVHDRTLLRDIYARADLLLFPSLYDNAPLVIQEAASVHCPALILNNSNAAEGITDGFNGFLAENNTESIARRIIAAIANRKGLMEAGHNAYHTLYRSWDTVIEAVKEKYEGYIRSYRARQ